VIACPYHMMAMTSLPMKKFPAILLILRSIILRSIILKSIV